MAVPPTKTGFVSSLGLYGYRAGRTSGQRQWHGGWDFRGSAGDPVLAAEAGTVETIVRDNGRVLSVLTPPPPARAFNGYGNVVVVRQADGTWASYNHLHEIVVGPGQVLVVGQVLGTIGNTTNGKFRGMGAHLHFELRHVQPDGSSPFPGPYGRFGIDPSEWFSSKGLSRTRGVLAGLGQQAPGRIEYEPPLRFWTPVSGTLLGVVILLGAVWLGLRSQRGLSKRSLGEACGLCFPWAYAEVTRGKGGILVHGTIATPTKSPEHRFDHAWVERDGMVYDWQTMEAHHGGRFAGKGFPVEIFRELFRPREEKRFTAEQAMAAALKYRRHGPW